MYHHPEGKQLKKGHFVCIIFSLKILHNFQKVKYIYLLNA